MSKQAAIDFLSKVESDPNVRQDVLKSVDQVVSAGAKHGYQFSGADLKEAIADKWKVHPTTHSGSLACAQYCTLQES